MKLFKCLYCGLEVKEIPKWKKGECLKERLQHEFDEIEYEVEDDTK